MEETEDRKRAKITIYFYLLLHALTPPNSRSLVPDFPLISGKKVFWKAEIIKQFEVPYIFGARTIDLKKTLIISLYWAHHEVSVRKVSGKNGNQLGIFLANSLDSRYNGALNSGTSYCIRS